VQLRTVASSRRRLTSEVSYAIFGFFVSVTLIGSTSSLEWIVMSLALFFHRNKVRVALISGVPCKVSRDRNQSSFPSECRTNINEVATKQLRGGGGLGGIGQWRSNHGVNK